MGKGNREAGRFSMNNGVSNQANSGKMATGGVL